MAGETKVVDGQVAEDDAAVDMTGGEVLWATAEDAIVKKTADGTITWVNQPLGYFTLTLSPVETATLSTAKGSTTFHECWAKTAAGRVFRVWQGRITAEAPLVTPIA